MSIIGWMILGLIAGGIASRTVNESGEGPVLDIVLGIVGAMVGGFLFSSLGAGPITGLDIFAGAGPVILVYHAVALARQNREAHIDMDGAASERCRPRQDFSASENL